MDSFWTSSQDSLTRFKDHGAFELIKHDVAECFPESVGSVDQIYHLACPASPIRFPENPLGILKTCFEGTQNVLELARKCGARVLLASTSGTITPSGISNESNRAEQRCTETR